MATIKPIEGRSVHQIQSGQVIVDLCSVVKELVENSLDAGATSIDVRFKNQGLESIEVQDNGSGISSDNYQSVALKHYTSKLSTYNDLSQLNTFGFRGEALSSLCALSKFRITTARDGEAPKGTRLDFEQSGALKETSFVASTVGTTVIVENLFFNLPVRRRELEKNIKREYGKVLAILHAYACISTEVKFTVTNSVGKARRTTVFSTKSNPTTRENIANVYGIKTISALIPLDLKFELQTTAPSQVLASLQDHGQTEDNKIIVEGHVSKPISGEGRQTPDRQMFFVNSRPCGLPQIAKAFNEVYKSYNITQSPFVFANFRMNTNAYDVNVSPDKRSIMLHDQTALLEKLKDSLVNLFESQTQTVPQSQLSPNTLPAFKPLTINPNAVVSPKQNQVDIKADAKDTQQPELTGLYEESPAGTTDGEPTDLIAKFASRSVSSRNETRTRSVHGEGPSEDKQKLSKSFVNGRRKLSYQENNEEVETLDSGGENSTQHTFVIETIPQRVQDFNDRLASQQKTHLTSKSTELVKSQEETPSDISGASLHAVTSTRPISADAKHAGSMSHTSQSPGINREDSSQPSIKRRRLNSTEGETSAAKPSQSSRFAARIRAFGAPGTQNGDDGSDADADSDHEDEPDGKSDSERENSQEVQELDEAVDLENEKSSNEYEEQPSQSDEDGQSDREYVDEEESRQVAHAHVQKLVKEAEESAARPTQDNDKRAARLLTNNSGKDSSLNLMTTLNTDIESIQSNFNRLNSDMAFYLDGIQASKSQDEADESSKTKLSPEERLSLTIDRSDFSSMRIVGQFNLGFILAVRAHPQINPQQPSTAASSSSSDLFIIDQHASDEIYNFHRLTVSTTLTPQPLVRPHVLALTAIEEETAIAHAHASLAKNGFKIEINTSGDVPVGSRIRLLTLPTSKETIFDVRDLEELLVLLADTPEPSPPLQGVEEGEDDNDGWNASSVTVAPSHNIVRPSKVRKMLAMRACRSSIMVGKTLSHAGMQRVVRHMGEIERPWNCPHGRPTMRHLAGLGNWESWREGDDVGDGEEVARWMEPGSGCRTDWRGWVAAKKQHRDVGGFTEDEDAYDEYADEGGEGVEIDVAQATGSDEED